MYTRVSTLREMVFGKICPVFFHAEAANLLEGIVAATANARKTVFLSASQQLFCVHRCLKNTVKPNNIIFYCF